MAQDRTKQRRWKSHTRSGKENWPEKFLKALCDIPNVTRACQKAKVVRMTAYQLRKDNESFAKAWDDCIDAGIDNLEAAAMERARFGTPRAVWMKDENGVPKKVDTVTDYPESLVQFLLKAHRPDRYREKPAAVDLSAALTVPGKGGEPEQRAEFTVHVSAEELP